METVTLCMMSLGWLFNSTLLHLCNDCTWGWILLKRREQNVQWKKKTIWCAFPKKDLLGFVIASKAAWLCAFKADTLHSVIKWRLYLTFKVNDYEAIYSLAANAGLCTQAWEYCARHRKQWESSAWACIHRLELFQSEAGTGRWRPQHRPSQVNHSFPSLTDLFSMRISFQCFGGLLIQCWCEATI